MRERAAIFALPVAALGAIGAIVLGPGAPREVRAARVLAAAAEEARFTARLELAEALVEAEAPVAARGVLVEVDGVSTSVDTARDGTAEVALDVPEGTAPFVVRVASESGETLAHGRVPRVPSGWASRAARPRDLAAAQAGELAVRVVVPRASLVSGFPERARVEVRASGAPVAGATVDLASDAADLAAGGDPAPALRVVTGADGAASFGVIARGHVAALEATARDGAREGRAIASLPVVPGACWLEAARAPGAPFRIVSSIARDAVWVDLAARGARIEGARVDLREDPRAGWVGTWAPRAAPPPGATLTVASDPRGLGAGTLAWPLDDGPAAAEARATPPVLVLDGMPAALARERARRARLRRFGATLLGVTAAAEIAMLLVAASRARRAVARLGEGELPPGVPLASGDLGPLVGAVVLLVTFAAIGWVALWRLQ